MKDLGHQDHVPLFLEQVEQRIHIQFNKPPLVAEMANTRDEFVLGLGSMVQVVGLGSQGPEFKSCSAVELIPGGVD